MDKTNNLYQFLVGAASAMGGDDNNVTQCLNTIPNWIQVGTSEATQPESLDTQADKGQESTWTKILSILGTSIDVCCAVKDIVKSLFASRRLRWLRRNRRLFLQGKRMRKFVWSFSGAWNSFTTSVSGAFGSFQAGLAKLKNKVVDGVDWAVAKAEVVANYVKEKVTAIFKPIGEWLDSLKIKLINLLMKNTFFRALGENFLKCFISLKGISSVIGVVSAISNFASVVAALITPIGWVNFVVNLVCGWEKLKLAIASLKAAWNATVPATKYNEYGKVAGYFILAAGGN
jgi:hypothetical protein